MPSIELNKVLKVPLGVCGIVSKETHESNRNESNHCERYCWDHKEK